MDQTAACRAYEGEFRGWRACFLENAFVRLAAVPDIGGRVMAYDLGPYPFIFVNDALAGKLFSPDEHLGDGSLAAWKNYGGDKTWPAPQGWEGADQWPGPPDPVLDSGRYTLDALGVGDGRAMLAMTSPPDARTSLQITRRLALLPASSRVHLDLTFHNIGERAVRWSIWDVIQLRAERRLPDGTMAHEPACTVTVPLNPTSRFERGYHAMFGADDNPQWQVDAERGLFVAPYLFEIGKVGLDSKAGWIAFANAAAGYVFAARFAYEPDGDYPDGGASVEIWTTGAGRVGNMSFEDNPLYHVEAEVLSPLHNLEPGASASFQVEWGACRGAGPVVAVTEAGCLSAPLHVARLSSHEARLTLAGGVFDAGDLALEWRGAAGERLASQALGHVDPLTPVALDRAEALPPGARSLAVTLTPEGAATSLTLAETAV